DILAHALHSLVWRAPLTLLGIQIQAFNDMQQPGAAENLLRNVLQAFLQVTGNIWHNELLRHCRLFHQNESPGTVDRRQPPAYHPDGQPSCKERQQYEPSPPS